jgi:hypothetical protein
MRDVFISIGRKETNEYAKPSPNALIEVIVCPRLFSFSQGKKKDKRGTVVDGKNAFFVLKNRLLEKKNDKH